VNFVQDNYYNCSSKKKAIGLPDDLFMGPRETRTDYRGEIFAPTARNPPWNVIDGVIDNPEVQFPQSKLGNNMQESSSEQLNEELEAFYNEI
jgi:hypothetical protein